MKYNPTFSWGKGPTEVTGPEPTVSSHDVALAQAPESPPQRRWSPRPAEFGSEPFPLPVWPHLLPTRAKVPTPGVLCDHSVRPAQQLSSLLPSLHPGFRGLSGSRLPRAADTHACSQVSFRALRWASCARPDAHSLGPQVPLWYPGSGPRANSSQPRPRPLRMWSPTPSSLLGEPLSSSALSPHSPSHAGLSPLNSQSTDLMLKEAETVKTHRASTGPVLLTAASPQPCLMPGTEEV